MAASLAAMSPGADSRGQGPVLIGGRPNACELNEKITRSGRNQLQLSRCLFYSAAAAAVSVWRRQASGCLFVGEEEGASEKVNGGVLRWSSSSSPPPSHPGG